MLAVKKEEDQKKRPKAAENEDDIRNLPRNEQLKRQKEKIKKNKEPPGPAFGQLPPSVNHVDLSTY